MRLTCPNCSARYEVDESMIPAAGRDVQCSNCSTTWFQPGPRVEAPVAADPVSEPEVTDPQVEADEVDPPASAEPESEAREPADEPSRDGPDEDHANEDDAVEGPVRREIDAGVADILREEAERETRLRRGDATPDPVETQSEMPLTSNEDSARTRRLAELEEAEDAFEAEEVAATAAVAATASRSELLPDIEEINSTLRATGDRSQGEDDASDVDTLVVSARRRSSARRGFALVILLAVMAVGVYVYAGPIVEAVPQAAGVLDAYVDAVNNARFWIDDMARSMAGGAAG